MPGFALAEGRREVFDARAERRRTDPAQARHLHLRRERARSLRAHDRDGDAAPKRGSRAAARPCSSTAQLPQRVAPLAEVAPILRGAVQPARTRRSRAPGRRLILDFRADARDPEFRQRRRARALQPGRRGHARPHHPHQELAADRAAPAGRQARRLQARRARRRRRPSSSSYRTYFARNNARVGGDQEDARSAAARRAGAGRSACSGSAASKKDARDRRRPRRGRDRDHHRRRGDRTFRVDLRSRHVRHGILVARAGQARQPPGKPLAGQIAVDHRRRRRHRRRDRAGLRGGRRRGRAARHRRGRARKRQAKTIGGAALAVPAT